MTLLVGRQEGHPACKKTEWWGAGVVICLEQGADLHMAQLMPLPLTVSCFSKIQMGFTFLVPAYTGSPRKRPLNARARMCVCVTAVYDGTKMYWAYLFRNADNSSDAPSCTSLLQQSLSLTSRAHSSKPAAAGLLLRAHAGTDGRTQYRFTDPVPHTKRAMPISK